MFKSTDEKLKYCLGSAKMGHRYIFVEGFLDKLVYNKIIFFKNLKNVRFEYMGGGCSYIISLLSQHDNFFAIIDNDCRSVSPHKKAARIDYYSIENIFINYSKKFKKLNKLLDIFFETSNITDLKSKSIEISKNKSLFFGNRNQKQYNNYLDKKIIDKKSYKKYADLKKIAHSFYTFEYQNNLESFDSDDLYLFYSDLNNDIKHLIKSEDFSALPKD